MTRSPLKHHPKLHAEIFARHHLHLSANNYTTHKSNYTILYYTILEYQTFG